MRRAACSSCKAPCFWPVMPFFSRVRARGAGGAGCSHHQGRLQRREQAPEVASAPAGVLGLPAAGGLCHPFLPHVCCPAVSPPPGQHKHRRARRIKSHELSEMLGWSNGVDNASKRQFVEWLLRGNMPQWLQFSDWERAAVLQALVTSLWPGVNDLTSVQVIALAAMHCNVPAIPACNASVPFS